MDCSPAGRSASPGSPRELSAKLQAERRRADALKMQLSEAVDSINEMRSVDDARRGEYPVGLPEQARLLHDAQQVVLELKADLGALQAENSELRKLTVSTEAQERLRELQMAFDSAVEKHRRETKENRFKTLRLQQEGKKLRIQVQELELELAARPKSLVMEEEAQAKIDLLETANEELRRDNAALRDEKLTYMTTELQRLHPSGKPKPDSQEAEIERLNQTVDGLTNDLAATKQKVVELTEKTASQDDLLERRTAEYEALLQSRRAELETMGILSNSLQETQSLYDSAQEEISKLQEENRELISEAMMAAAAKDREKSIASPASPEETRSLDDMKEELAMVKKTASGAISTLSNSLKKALVQSQELCQNFEKDRMEMKTLNEQANLRVRELEERLAAAEHREALVQKEIDAKSREVASFKQQMEEQRLRTKEAKQRLKAEILDTKQLIKSQQEDFKEEIPEDDDDYLALLDIPKRARELFNHSPMGTLEEPGEF
eukprot:TRINITY_DN19422_c0_g1_i1.p1 TRINITY_DN19422_c0_g1~~TRINITY_DN19422_c0_g1_i1.p1  ORF type:complete len:495 (+),score=256.77 TRINITY_DN19422_c0_g1_i1:102-1586(+)